MNDYESAYPYSNHMCQAVKNVLFIILYISEPTNSCFL